MKEEIRYLDTFVNQLSEHPLYEWTTSAPLEDGRRHYDTFVPLLGWIMTFRYYNEIYLAYELGEDPEPSSLTRLREIINEHVSEDRTHIHLFLQDMRRLAIDDVWRLQTPSSLLWTIWVSPMLDDVRTMVSKRVEAVVAHEDELPAFRYLHIEQVERDGNLLFSAIHTATDRVIAQRGATPVYFGEHHLDRETGHVGKNEFEEVPLSPEESMRARGIIEYKHSISIKMNDALYRYVSTAEPYEHSGIPLLNEQQASLASLRERIEEHQAGRIEAPRWNIRPGDYGEQSELIAAWHRHHADFVSHPFARLCGATGKDDAGFVLRAAALLLANRISALHTFYLHDCRVDEDRGEGAREVNFIGGVFSTEAEMFFHDWDVLEMDQRIPWKPADMLEWWFLDEVYGRPELQALHEWRREALRVHDPVGKYWAMMSVHMMSRAFFGSIRQLADRFAEANPDKPRLVYFENVHHLLYDRIAKDYANPGHPTSLAHLPVTAAQQENLLRMMDTFARLGMRQFDNMARALTTDREQFAFLRG